MSLNDIFIHLQYYYITPTVKGTEATVMSLKNSYITY